MTGCWATDMQALWTARLGAVDEDALRVPSGPDLAARIGVYRGNWLGVAVQTLYLRYPVCAAVVGARCFRAMTRDYLAFEPLVDRDLADYGAGLPAFLDQRVMTRPGFAGLPYLVDLARLEDAVFVSARLPAGPGLDFAQFAGTPASRREQVRLRLAESVRLLPVAWNVDEIHAAHRNGSVGDGVEYSRCEAFLVVFRGAVCAIGPRQFALLRCLRGGATLKTLAERCTDDAAAARVVESLRAFIVDGWIAGFGVNDVFQE